MQALPHKHADILLRPAFSTFPTNSRDLKSLFWHPPFLDPRLCVPATWLFIIPGSPWFVYDRPPLIFCTVYSKHIYCNYLWFKLARAVTGAPAPVAITTCHRSIKIHPPQTSQQLHSPPSWSRATVNLMPPWEKMGDFVLKLINAPINDLSGFASKQGFTLFESFFFFLHNCGCSLFFPDQGVRFLFLLCVYIFKYADTPCQFTLPVFVVETHYFVLERFKWHARKCYGNR